MRKSRRSGQPIQFVTFATAWGSSHGGLNSFNRDFTAAFAQAVNGRVACVVPGASDEDKADASNAGVLLLPLGSNTRDEFDMGSASLIPTLDNFSQVEWWIGHDIITGEFASAVRTASQGRLAVIMHQSYEDYGGVKHPTKGATDKARRQRDLFSKADEIFAVGPLLAERLKDMCGRGKVIIPGLRIVDHRPAENSLNVV